MQDFGLLHRNYYPSLLCYLFQNSGEKKLKDCMKQVETTNNSTTMSGREQLQQRYTESEALLKQVLQALQLVQQQSSLADELSKSCDEVSDWITESKAKVVECRKPWNNETELEGSVADLEVRFDV